jgi:RNA polymerase sigma-70 factor, ECF subfamily
VTVGSTLDAPFSEAEFRSHFDFLYAFALSLSRNRATADDLVQDTLLRAWTHRSSFERGSNLRAWLSRILRNLFLSGLRRRIHEVGDPEDQFTLAVAQRPNQEHRIVLRELARDMDTLPQPQREALVLVGLGGFSYEEVADRMDCPKGSVKSRVSRARQTLTNLQG